MHCWSVVVPSSVLFSDYVLHRQCSFFDTLFCSLVVCRHCFSGIACFRKKFFIIAFISLCFFAGIFSSCAKRCCTQKRYVYSCSISLNLHKHCCITFDTVCCLIYLHLITLLCDVALRPNSTRRTSWKLVANPGLPTCSYFANRVGI